MDKEHKKKLTSIINYINNEKDGLPFNFRLFHNHQSDLITKELDICITSNNSLKLNNYKKTRNKSLTLNQSSFNQSISFIDPKTTTNSFLFSSKYGKIFENANINPIKTVKNNTKPVSLLVKDNNSINFNFHKKNNSMNNNLINNSFLPSTTCSYNTKEIKEIKETNIKKNLSSILKGKGKIKISLNLDNHSNQKDKQYHIQKIECFSFISKKTSNSPVNYDLIVSILKSTINSLHKENQVLKEKEASFDKLKSQNEILLSELTKIKLTFINVISNLKAYDNQLNQNDKEMVILNKKLLTENKYLRTICHTNNNFNNNFDNIELSVPKSVKTNKYVSKLNSSIKKTEKSDKNDKKNIKFISPFEKNDNNNMKDKLKKLEHLKLDLDNLINQKYPSTASTMKNVKEQILKTDEKSKEINYQDLNKKLIFSNTRIICNSTKEKSKMSLCYHKGTS